MRNILFADFETRCRLDLSVVGLDNYVRQAESLMLGWAINDRKVRIWLPMSEKMPAELEDAVLNPDFLVVSWYAQFERLIFRHCHKVEIPIPRFRDPMIYARHMSMPGKLDSVCEILKIGKDEAKIKDGDRLIKLFSIPNGQEGQETLYGVSKGFNLPEEHPQDWKRFQEYCIRDTEIERKIFHLLEKFTFPEEQWADWHRDQRMNERGMPFNSVRAKKALGLAVRYKEESKKELNKMTGLANANSTQQLLPWLDARGYAWGSMEKKYVDTELANPHSKLTPEARAVLELRRKSSQNSYKKLEKMLNLVSPDGRIRFQFAYMGAARTGRWSAYGAQVMNMPRPIKAIKKMDAAQIFDLIDREAYDEILKKFDNSVLPFVASVIRMMFEAPPDKKMVVCDLSSIEYGVVGWLARGRAIMECLRLKRDAYIDFVPHLYPDRGYTYESVMALAAEIRDVLRQQAKAPVLGGGFGLGGGELVVNQFGDTVRTGMWGYALNVCGVDMSKELAHAAVRAYRKVNHEVVQLWADMENAFKWVLKHGGKITVGEVTWDKQEREWIPVSGNFTGAKITFSRVQSKACGNIIRMRLPSGRYLHYLNAHIEEEQFTWTNKDTGRKETGTSEVLYYAGIEHSQTEDEEGAIAKKSHKWGKTKTYGGKLTENAVQAIARDVLVHGTALAEEMLFEIFGLFHDEMATLVMNSWDAPTLNDLRFCMSESPAWAPTMILGAEGYTGQYYKKG